MKDDGSVVLIGIFIGAVIYFSVQIATKSTPDQIKKSIYKEAVELGHGRWVIETDKIVEGAAPPVKFQWITNSTVK